MYYPENRTRVLSVILHLERHLTKSVIKDRVWIYVTERLKYCLLTAILFNFVSYNYKYTALATVNWLNVQNERTWTE